MNRTLASQAAGKIGFAGEQIISHLDELSRTPCPKCGECELTVTIVKQNVVIRCSEHLQDYNNYEEDEVIPQVCDYVQVIKKSNLSQPPFTYTFSKDGKRGTLKNSKPPRATRKRSS